MALTKYKLGKLICEVRRNNADLKYGIEAVRGISNSKRIMATKAAIDVSVLYKFSVVLPGEFVYNPRTTRMGDKVGLVYNGTNHPLLFSFNNIVFALKNTAKNIILDEYLYLYFNRTEFDRYAIVNSWGSATELFTFEEMCDIEIELPDLATQQKYVDIYNAMVANQQSYERGLDDLKLVCDGYIEDLRRKMPCEKIGQYICQKSDKNTDNSINRVMGLSTKKEFREAQSRVNRNELKNYKIVNSCDFAYVPTTDTWKVLAFAVNDFRKSIVVSPIYEVFSVDISRLLPQYLAMWLSRKEFDRYARFNSWGSARENFSFDEMQNVEIPIPDISIQQSIVDIYHVYMTRKSINEKLKAQIKNICPILIRGSLVEARVTK